MQVSDGVEGVIIVLEDSGGVNGGVGDALDGDAIGREAEAVVSWSWCRWGHDCSKR